MVMKRAFVLGMVLQAVAAVAWGGATAPGDGGTVKLGNPKLLVYKHGDVAFKPYVKDLHTPGGINVLRDAPHDHLHHHALMYAMKVDGVNFWEEVGEAGRQLTKEVVREDDGLRTRLHWVNTGDEVLLHEDRRIRVPHVAQPGATLAEWTSRFTVPEGRDGAVLGGNHYHGLGMRFVASMDENGTFLSSSDAEGEVVRGTERLTPGAWCAYRAEAEGKPVTVAMFDHPDNPRPALWFTMTEPFAYLSATINLWREPLEMKQGETVTLTYGVAVWDGYVARDTIARLYRKWLLDREGLPPQAPEQAR